MIAVSRCLLGDECRYDSPALLLKHRDCDLITSGILPICPECAGGLSVPRVPCELVVDANCTLSGGEAVLAGKARVINRNGEDMTSFFLHGAIQSAELIRARHCKAAYLSRKSPSCGVGTIYDGTFSHTLTTGDGVLAALLAKMGIPAYAVTPEYLFRRLLNG